MHFKGENRQTQYSVVSHKIDLYFLDYKLALEVDEKGHKVRNNDHEKTKKPIKEFLIDEISKRLLRLEFKKDNSIKSKALKYTAYIIKMKLKMYFFWLVGNIQVMLAQKEELLQIK